MIVIARGILNQNEVNEFVDEIVSKVNQPYIKKWIAKQLRKYIINDYPDVDKVTDLPSNVPEWAIGAFKRGDLYTVRFVKEFKLFIKQVLLHFLKTQSPKQLSGLQFVNALENAEKWRITLEKQGLRPKDAITLLPIKEYSNGYAWYELTRPKQIYQEGVLLSNCLKFNRSGKQYARMVLQGKLKLFSLRNAKGNPKVSLGIDVKHKSVKELVCKNNLQVTDKYWPMVLEFLNKELRYLHLNNVDWTCTTWSLNIHRKKFININSFTNFPEFLLGKSQKVDGVNFYSIKPRSLAAKAVASIFRQGDSEDWLEEDADALLSKEQEKEVYVGVHNGEVCFIAENDRNSLVTVYATDDYEEEFALTPFAQYIKFTRGFDDFVIYEGETYDVSNIHKLLGKTYGRNKTQEGTWLFAYDSTDTNTTSVYLAAQQLDSNFKTNDSSCMIVYLEGDEVVFHTLNYDITKEDFKVIKHAIPKLSVNDITKYLIYNCGFTIDNANVIVDQSQPNNANYTYVENDVFDYSTIYGNEVKIEVINKPIKIIAKIVDTKSIWDMKSFKLLDIVADKVIVSQSVAVNFIGNLPSYYVELTNLKALENSSLFDMFYKVYNEFSIRQFGYTEYRIRGHGLRYGGKLTFEEDKHLQKEVRQEFHSALGWNFHYSYDGPDFTIKFKKGLPIMSFELFSQYYEEAKG